MPERSPVGPLYAHLAAAHAEGWLRYAAASDEPLDIQVIFSPAEITVEVVDYETGDVLEYVCWS